MGNPAVNFLERDGNLGQVIGGRLPIAIVGPATGGSGVALQAQGFAQAKDLAAVHAAGHLYDAGVDIMTAGVGLFAVRSAASAAGSLSAVTHAGAGTSVVTASGTPTGDYQVRVLIATGGTIGTAGIQYQASLDNGRNYGPLTDLGTATSITNILGSGVNYAFAAGTVLAAQTESVLTTGPQSSAADITAALNVLKANSTDFEIVCIATPLTNAIAAAVDVWIASMRAMGRYVCWCGAFRVPAPAETEATYLAAFTAAFGAYGSTYCVGITAGSVYYSDFAGQFVRPIWRLAGSLGAIPRHVDPAELANGPLVGYSLVDTLGNNVHHDELLSPGFYAARGSCLQQGPGGIGVYWTGVRVMSAPGSDFLYPQARRIMNAAEYVSRVFWLWKLHQGVPADRATGLMPESTMLTWEQEADAALTALLGPGPAASGWRHVITRGVNVMASGKLPVTMKIQPLIYMKEIEVTAEYAAKIVA